MKKNFLKSMAFVSLLSLTSCTSLFIFGNETEGPVNNGELTISDRFKLSVEDFAGTKNSIFFALYNYYGYEGQHFTYKWLGMAEALARHGVIFSNYEEEKDARNFIQTKNPETYDLPEDAVIYMVNNQNWDSGIQFTRPFAMYHPMAVISTCNGVEFASSPILSTGEGIANATMGGFSDTYRTAFLNGSLKYVSAKYTAHILPIFAACVDAVENGVAMRNDDGTALRLSVPNWAIQTIDEYDEMDAVDSIDIDHPTMRKVNVDKYFDKTSDSYGVANLTEFVENSSKEAIKALYAENGTAEMIEADLAARPSRDKKITCGIIAPSSVNDQVQKYIDYIKGYLATAYDVQILPTGSVTSSNSQDTVAKTLINQGANFIISLQDDTDRNKAAKVCNDNKVFFGIAGSCQNSIDYNVIKNYEYYVGSIGTSPEEEKRAADEMTEYYLQCMIHRAKGDLLEWQIQYKNIEDLYHASLLETALKPFATAFNNNSTTKAVATAMYSYDSNATNAAIDSLKETIKDSANVSNIITSIRKIVSEALENADELSVDPELEVYVAFKNLNDALEGLTGTDEAAIDAAMDAFREDIAEVMSILKGNSRVIEDTTDDEAEGE